MGGLQNEYKRYTRCLHGGVLVVRIDARKLQWLLGLSLPRL